VGFPTLLFYKDKKMNIEDLENRVREVIEPVIKSLGVELENIEFGKMQGKLLLRIFIDKQGGVTIGDCELVSREIEAVLDVEDPIPCSYILEVSSPGLDRPLRRPEDFKRFSGKTVRVITHNPVDNQTFFVGEIIEAGDVDVVLLLPKDRKVTITYENISRARLEVEV
jgi:ribosome maturation factor RimP